jgi:hypothetical protein
MGKNETSGAREDDDSYEAIMDLSHRRTSELHG